MVGLVWLQHTCCATRLLCPCSEHYNDQIRMLLENGYTDEELKEVGGAPRAGREVPPRRAALPALRCAFPRCRQTCLPSAVPWCARQVLKKNRDEELDHLKTANDNGAAQVPVHPLPSCATVPCP